MPHHLVSRTARIVSALLILSPLAHSQTLPDAPSAVKRPPSEHAKSKPTTKRDTESAQSEDAPWPREAIRGDEKILIYQPQIESWQDDELHAYAALALQRDKDASKQNYGVVWFTAQTEVDKVNRQVTLDNFHIVRIKLPSLRAKEGEYENFLQSKLPQKAKVIALDRLEADLATLASEQGEIKGLTVNNDPPRMIFTTKPALLVVIDGPPKFRDVWGTTFRKVLNSQSNILLDTKTQRYYLNVMDGWLDAPDLEGPWAYTSKVPEDMKEITKSMQERQEDKAAEGAQPASLKQANKEGKLPAIYVTQGPAELLVTDGAPKFEPLSGTTLEYVKNTTAAIFRDPADDDHFILLAGRWFKSKSLENGPWEFVNGMNLPRAFAKIPLDSPKAGVLVSVPGTPPAQEALIANAIPQTATITRSEAHLRVDYDGDPQLKNIEGTELQYVVNTATPVIRVADKNYYAVENAVWFVAPSPEGPWVVATTVPEVIYTIPPDAPLHYVTYVKVYRSSPETVAVGYTPGYYGTVVSSTTNTVVYGTGWYYPPYVGTYWYGMPYTYGVGVASTWNSGTGWSVTIGVGYTYGYPYYYPWWGPWGYYGPCCWGPAWGAGYGGYAATNVYGRWGNAAYANTRAAWANPYTGNYGAVSQTAYQNTQRGTVGVAGRGTNTNVYTGNTTAGRGAVAYDPKTGVVAGGGAGYAGNIYSGQGAAGRGGFAYDTNTKAGVAATGNNVYAGKDGTVYRYDRQNGNWSQNSGSGWQSTGNPQPNLQSQQQARAVGQQRAQNFSGSMSGGMRGGGRRR